MSMGDVRSRNCHYMVLVWCLLVSRLNQGIRKLKRTCRSGLNRSWEYYIGVEADKRQVYFYEERADGRMIRQARAVY